MLPILPGYVAANLAKEAACLLCANQDSNTVTLLNDGEVRQTVSVEMPVCVCVESQLEITEYNGHGYKPLVDSDGWRVAIANYKPELELSRLDYLERHLETDEVFILLEGECGLLIGKERLQIPLKPGKVCNVKKEVWNFEMSYLWRKND